MRPKIKICGLMREEDIPVINETKPDYVGVIFARGRKRTIDMEQAARLRRRLAPSIPMVGVFWNQEIDWIVELVCYHIIQVVQLHADETETEIETIKSLCDVPIIKALSVKTGEEVLAWQNSQADYLLLDNGKGGTGQTFDWKLLAGMQLTKPYFIAGGLNTTNIEEAMKWGAYGLDVSSGVETNGRKDPVLIREIMNIMRRQ